jgi:hypothetical protein
MRRLAPAVAVVAVVVVALALVLRAGGGGGEDETPLGDALGYFAQDAPLVASAETDPDGEQAKTLRELLDRFPFGDQAQGMLRDQLDVFGLSSQRDLRPLLGHPLVIGLSRPVATGDDAQKAVVAALHVDRPSKAKQLLLREPGATPRGRVRGVRVFEDRTRSRFAAVDGDVLVAAGSFAALSGAIDRRRGDDRLREDRFDEAFEHLPEGAAARVSADPRALIHGSPRLRPLLKVAWVASIRHAAGVLRFRDDGVTADLEVRTDKDLLTASDVPIAPGSRPPPLIGRDDEVRAAVRDPRRVLRFAEAVARALFPVRAERVDRLARARGVDLSREVLEHADGSGAVAVDPFSRVYAARLGVRDPAGVEDGLAQLAPVLPQMAAAAGIGGVGVAAPGQGERFYALARPDGKSLVFGVVGPSFVVSNDARRAASLPSEATTRAPVTGGTAVLTADARELAARLLADRLGGLAGLAAPLAVRSLGDLSAWAKADRSALFVHARLSVR